MSIENSDTSDLLFRYNDLVSKYVELSIDISQKLEKFGKYRKELQILTVELVKRDVVSDLKSLEDKITEELNRVNKLINDEKQKNNT